MTTPHSPSEFDGDAVRSLREDLALALRAAAHHGLAEGVCNHFSIELPDRSGRFLLNPRGLLWSEVRGDDIVMVDGAGQRLAGKHPVANAHDHKRREQPHRQQVPQLLQLLAAVFVHRRGHHH